MWEYRILHCERPGRVRTTLFDSDARFGRRTKKGIGTSVDHERVRVTADWLNELGADGWELVSTWGTFQSESGATFVFKRKAQ
jgi:hypothetical protein